MLEIRIKRRMFWYQIHLVKEVIFYLLQGSRILFESWKVKIASNSSELRKCFFINRSGIFIVLSYCISMSDIRALKSLDPTAGVYWRVTLSSSKLFCVFKSTVTTFTLVSYWHFYRALRHQSLASRITTERMSRHACSTEPLLPSPPPPPTATSECCRVLISTT